MISITYMILCHGEPSALELIDYLKDYWDEGIDQIAVLNDPTTPEYEADLRMRARRVVSHRLEKDYAAHRNVMLQFLKTDYTFALDADEAPHMELIKNLKPWLEDNGRPHIVVAPRCNVFEGVLPVHALMYGWTIKDGIVQWPDLQRRIFRNRQGIKWVSPLHETLKALPHHRTVALPKEQKWAIIHRKQIAKQVQDNTKYAAEWPQEDNAGVTTEKLLKA
jgi:hypothetical protein